MPPQIHERGRAGVARAPLCPASERNKIALSVRAQHCIQGLRIGLGWVEAKEIRSKTLRCLTMLN